MRGSLKKSRRSPVRSFQPALDGALEDRVLLSSNPFGKNYAAESKFLLKVKTARAARNLKAPPQLASNAPHFNNVQGYRIHKYIGTQTVRGGQNVIVSALDGSHYQLALSYVSNTIATSPAEGSDGQGGNSTSSTNLAQVQTQAASYPQPIGTIRAYPMSDGRVGIIIDGSTQNTELTINPLGQPQVKGFAQSFAYGESKRGHVLNIGQLTVTSGEIGDILGFQDADLSGPLTAMSTNAIDRIALLNVLPGASINTGGDVNTLDILGGIDLSGSSNFIHIGRDLNLLNVGTNITLSNGATFTIGRNLGLVSQAPKGTGTGTNVLTLNYASVANSIVTVSIPPVGSFIQGSVNIDTANGSSFLIGGNIFNTMYIEGSVTGFSGLLINTATAPTSPPFENRIGENSAGFVTALGGETG